MSDRSFNDLLNQASFGLQRPLELSSVSAGLQMPDNIRSPLLINQPALADGTYYARVYIGGVSALNLQMTATFSAGSVTITPTTSYYCNETTSQKCTDATRATAPYVYQTFSGTAALATTVRTQFTLAATAGEQMMIVKIVVAGGAAPVFTQAEINGR